MAGVPSTSGKEENGQEQKAPTNRRQVAAEKKMGVHVIRKNGRRGFTGLVSLKAEGAGGQCFDAWGLFFFGLEIAWRAMRKFALIGLGLCSLFVVWLVWPAAPVDLRAVNAPALAQREAAAWRAYYEERYPVLFWQVFQVTYSEYGFSLWDSLRMSVDAAMAGMSFRNSNDPGDIARALTGIEKYYEIIKAGTVQEFDSREVARLEIRWWQMRREKLPPEEWAQTMAHQCALIYGIPADDFLPAVRLRVEAMVQRDASRDLVMNDVDWESIQALLTKSATMFAEVCRGENGPDVSRSGGYSVISAAKSSPGRSSGEKSAD